MLSRGAFDPGDSDTPAPKGYPGHPGRVIRLALRYAPSARHPSPHQTPDTATPGPDATIFTTIEAVFSGHVIREGVLANLMQRR